MLDKELYERDYNLWQERSLAALRDRNSELLDWDNLIIEIAEAGKSQKRALKNYTQRLIEHLLKIKYWTTEKERNLAHWRIEVRNFREQILDILEDSPSLKSYLKQNYNDWYIKSVAKVEKEFNVSKETQFDLTELLNVEFFG
jgi:hypothetical protein